MALLSQTVKISQDAGPQNSKNLSKTKISQKSTGSVEIEKFSKLKMFQVATNIAHNVGSYTQGRTAGDFLSSRKAARAERCPPKTTAAALDG